MRKQMPAIILLFYILGILGIITAILTGYLTSLLPPELTSRPWAIWLILGALVTISGFLSYWLYRLQSGSESLSTLPTLESRNRQWMIEKVRTIWIKGVLENSLHGADVVALDLKEQPDEVENIWGTEVQETNRKVSPLPASTQITQIYDEAGGELLIMGEPGSGKTTMLLELTHHLLDRAVKDEKHPMPVIFNLSSWAIKRQPLKNWIAEELHLKYQVPRKLCQSWVDSDQILPLLDGLDEVAEEYRMPCVEALNDYRRDHGLLPMVVCCRTVEYQAQELRVMLRSAGVVQPMSDEQINIYLNAEGSMLDGLRTALQVDPVLHQLATSPLMLSVLSLAYHGRSVDDLVAADASTMQRLVWATYIQRIFERRGTAHRFAPQKTIQWLVWLAKQMSAHNQGELYLERMQSDWLSTPRLHQRYYRNASILILWLPFIVLSAVLVAMLREVSLLTACMLTLYLLFLLGSLWVGFTTFGTGSEFVEVDQRDFYISWEILRQDLPAFLTLGIFGGLIAALHFGLVMGLCFGVLGGLFFWVLKGAFTEEWENASSTLPFQIKHIVVLVLIRGMGMGQVFGVMLGISAAQDSGVKIGLVVGILILVLTILAGAGYGGGIALYHATLRFLLWREGCLPWNYIRFLDYAIDRILLRHVGGGYAFIHRLLQEHLASLDTIFPSPAFDSSARQTGLKP